MPDTLKLVFAWYVVFIFSTVLHEAAHALVAWKLGDSTAYAGGQVSLDPIPHIQRAPFGTVLIPLVTCFMSQGLWMIGWANAPYDPMWAREFPKRSALMALAGPVANFLLALTAAAAIRVGLAVEVFNRPLEVHRLTEVTVAAEVGGFTHGLAMILSILFSLNTILFVFNLMPFPPLDGSGVLPLFMARRHARMYMGFTQQPMVAMLGIVCVFVLFQQYFDVVFSVALGLLYVGS
jgi:Zn-dependent protease